MTSDQILWTIFVTAIIAGVLGYVIAPDAKTEVVTVERFIGGKELEVCVSQGGTYEAFYKQSWNQTVTSCTLPERVITY